MLCLNILFVRALFRLGKEFCNSCFFVLLILYSSVLVLLLKTLMIKFALSSANANDQHYAALFTANIGSL